MRTLKVSCPHCKRLFTLPAPKAANDNRAPVVRIHEKAHYGSGQVYREIATLYAKWDISRHSFLNMATSRVYEFLACDGHYIHMSMTPQGKVTTVSVKIDEYTLEDVFAPHSLEQLRWLDQIKKRARAKQEFKAPRHDVLERLQYLDLILKTPPARTEPANRNHPP